MKKTLIFLMILIFMFNISALCETSGQTNEALSSQEMTLSEGMPEHNGMEGGKRGGMVSGMRGQMSPEGFQKEFTPPDMNTSQAPESNSSTTTQDTEGQSQNNDGNFNRRMNGGNNDMQGGGMRRQMPENFNGDVNNQQTAKTENKIIKEYFTPVFAIVSLVLAFLFAAFYKRKTF